MEPKENVKVEEVSIQEQVEPAENQTKDTKDTKQQESEKVTTCEQQLEALKKELEETKDKYLRTAAELENTRRRSSIDIESAVRNRAISIASKFLPVMDAIEAALKHTPDDEGVKSMAKVMETTFAQLGITKIEAVGQKLNPQLHNAIQVIETKKESDETIAPNTIVEEMQTGYMFGDTVIRTAMVVVSK